MSAPWEMVVFSVLGLLGVGVQTTISLLRKPNWVKEDAALDANWKRLALYSAGAGVLFGLAALTLSLVQGFHGQAVAFAAVGGFVFFQSLFTDFRLRYVDRWIMRVANVIAAITGAIILSSYGGELDWVLYVVFTVAAIAVGFLPGIGDSDGRAFTFLVLAAYPTSAVAGIQWAALLIVVSISVYYIGYCFWKKSFSLKGLLSKVSFPMVPIVILPVLVVILFGNQLPGF